MSTSGSSSSNFSLLAADPEDSCPRDDDDDEALQKLIMKNHEEGSLPQSIVRALQRTAADMQDEELSGIMEEKIKQYVLSKEIKKAEQRIVDTEIDERILNETHQENGTGRVIDEEELVAKCEEEIQVYVKKQEQLESLGCSIGDNNQQNATVNNDPPSPVGTTNSSQSQSRSTRPLTREQLAAASLPNLPLEIGDHVYQWRSFVGIPGIFQHHGIVMDIGRDENGEMELKIADFSCILRSSMTVVNNDTYIKEKDQKSVDILTGPEDENNRRSLRSPHGVLRVYKSGARDPKWRKVHYRASVWKTSLWRSGTCTCVDSDPPAKVLARAYFLLEHPELLPSYHIFNSNCECVAVWCKTGKWCTLQASSVLSLTVRNALSIWYCCNRFQAHFVFVSHMTSCF